MKPIDNAKSNSKRKSAAGIKQKKTKKKTGKQTKKNTDYDSARKDVIEELFNDFLAFFFPKIHRDIDFSKKVEFLNRESQAIKPYGKIGKRLADVLVKVHLKGGSVKVMCIFIHIEVQGQEVDDFMQRMYIYNYRIFDKFIESGAKVVSMAKLTDKDENYRPDTYENNIWDFEHRMKIPMVKILDYNIDEKKINELNRSENPMAMIVRAQLKEYEARKGDKNKKYGIKRDLYRQCIEAGYSSKETRTIFKFIDWLIRLPEELQEKLKTEITMLGEDCKMAYIPTYEREAREEGLQQGRKEGRDEGRDEANLNAARAFLANGVDINIIAKSLGLSKKIIEGLAPILVICYLSFGFV
ncbi:MAG: hypothetical protein GY757_41345 [bacterium]|nr:hypothetical protein [bacterium]